MTSQALRSDTPNSSSSATTARPRRSGDRFSLGDELQRVDVERLVGDDALRLHVFLLELLVLLGVAGLHGATLIPPGNSFRNRRCATVTIYSNGDEKLAGQKKL